MKSVSANSTSKAPTSNITRVVVLVVLAVAVTGGYLLLGDVLSLDTMAQQETQHRYAQEAHPLVTYGAAFLIYVVVTGLSLPGATVLSLVYGWFFGFIRGFVLVSFASTTGATVAFLVSRYLFREFVRTRYGDRLSRFNAALERDGAYFLFTLRLIPAVPFFVINAVMGLTAMRVLTFWWVSQLGMLAGTAVYVFAGSSVPSLDVLAEEGVYAAFTPTQLLQLFVAFGLLGVFPLLTRWTMRYLGMTAPIESSTVQHEESRESN